MAQARLERMMNLVAYLSDSRKALTLREIVATVPGYPANLSSARRAFERDKEDLRAMNFDVAVLETPDGESGYRIIKENTFFDVKLTPAQRSVVEYALALYSPEKDVAAAAVTKLGGMNPENFVGEVTSLAMPDMVDELYSAASEKKSVKILFKGKQRVITPRRIIARSGYWYVEAHDINKNESRTFRVDRITEVSEYISNDDALAMAGTDEPDESDITFVVRIHPLLREQFCATWSATYDDNADTAQFTLSRKELFLARLFEYSGFVAVLEPSDIAQEIERGFETAAELIKRGA